MGKGEVLGQLWGEWLGGGETGEVGRTGFIGDRGQLLLTVYQDLGGTHLL